MKVSSIILARGGSKGIPNKNIRDFCGKPLISWTIEQCIEGGIDKDNYGVCWSENNNPTIDDSITYSDDEVMYTFIKNLTPNKRYYLRAFLNNEVGTSYSDIYEIQTLSSINVGDTFEDGVIVHIVNQDSEFYNDGMVNGLIARTSFRQDGIYRESGDFIDINTLFCNPSYI